MAFSHHLRPPCPQYVIEPMRLTETDNVIVWGSYLTPDEAKKAKEDPEAALEALKWMREGFSKHDNAATLLDSETGRMSVQWGGDSVDRLPVAGVVGCMGHVVCSSINEKACAEFTKKFH
eukprot:GHVR01001192.1.p1 GENE.GHVR01001192.1~~GHVR01001192.1.p1  ORF type:complete len:120 (+),score=32.73 GHVR01001192.1:52-411(+)